MASLRRVHALSLTAWFRVPEFMPHYEVLSRASAFAVRTSAEDEVTLVSSRHVSHPWLHQAQYYPDKPWLEHVHDDHIRYSVEAYDGDGRHDDPVLTWPLTRWTKPHPRLDLAALRVANPHAFQAAMAAAGLRLCVHGVAEERPDALVPLLFHGHVTRPHPQREGVDGEVPPELEELRHADAAQLQAAVPVAALPTTQLPQRVAGHVVARSDRQVFAHTEGETALEMGMCGGPVVLAAGCGAAGADGDGDCVSCVGVVEGTVPDDVGSGGALSDATRQLIAGTAVFVEVDDLREFVETL